MFKGAHPEYLRFLPRFRIVRDCVNDNVDSVDLLTQAVKSVAGGQGSYLVRTDGMSDETFKVLKQLAIYSNITGATLEAQTGLIWNQDPYINLPKPVEYLLTNASGEWDSLLTMMKQCTSELLSVGRYGVLVEPPASGAKTKADELSGSLTYAKAYRAESIIDWSESMVGSRKMLTLVKLEEMTEVRDANYNYNVEPRYRRLILRDGVYYQQVFKDPECLTPHNEEAAVLYAGGKTIDYIPFFFIGADVNRATPTNPPYYKLAKKNIGHYNLDALNRINLQLHGTGTLFITSSLGQEYFADNKISVGGGNGHFLGEQGSAALLQVDANGAIPAQMGREVEDMIQLGARLSMPSVQRTATEAEINSAQETALMSKVVGNTEEAFVNIVNEIMLAQGVSGNAEIKLSREFFKHTLDPQVLAQLISAKLQGVVPITLVWDAMRKGGLIPRDVTDDILQEKLTDAEI